jgi:hypothetical protein
MGLFASKTWTSSNLEIVKKGSKIGQVYETLNHDNFSMTTQQIGKINLS